MKELTRDQRRAVAAYLLDRADQYPDGSSQWVPLAAAAEAVMCGEFEEAWRHGEFDFDLYRRVDLLQGGRE